MTSAEQGMESAMAAMLAAAGLTFSVAIGLLVEEVVFGGVFRLLLHGQRRKAERRGKAQGGERCW